MRIVDLDYYALTGDTLLHKTPVGLKLLWAFGLIALVVISNDPAIFLVVYLIMLIYILFSKIKKKLVLLLTFYPLLFILVIVFSTSQFSFEFLLILSLKVLIAATSMVLLFATTSFIKLFSSLNRYLPGFLVTTLFLSYRAIFILWTTLENIQQALYLRGGLSAKKPGRSLKVLGNALGFLVIKSIESSEKMYEGLYLRGHSNQFKYLEEKNG